MVVKGSVFDILNLDRFGFFEVEFVQKVIDGVSFLIVMEKRLEVGLLINDFILLLMKLE